ncbi:hypothetical protein SAMN02799630_01209 [Paenibacillus sp. UNCCL117]|uniref:hypothetical protein n=1 Tax=unclassified Paenibacillus TaxID=185978 RepID=UPI00088D3848|nr:MULTISPECIES: hypothetical protein [unclassified Paenibacillus]SDC69578.1 hypothetical protein SAMN04488602_103187 [Paenibacillus sp. cl123]SFW23967.1 hypothetical protein SAMN02799630_01209 [Paenibacillus sp. UNCCL117]
MTNVFIGFGFGCLMLVTLAASWYITVLLLDMVLNKTRLLGRVFKLVNAFYESFPRKGLNCRYTVVLFDHKTHRFIDGMQVNEYGETEEETKEYFREMIDRHSRKR